MAKHPRVTVRLGWVVAATLLVVALIAVWQLLSRPRGPRGAAEGPAKEATQDASSLPAQADVGEALAAFNRGAAYLGQYKYAQAAAEFQQALERLPNWTAARLNLALAHLNMQEARGAGKYLEIAKQEFEQVLQDDPNNLYAWFALGTYYQHLGNIAEASECFRKVHEADPEDLHAAYKYAETLIAQKDNAAATRLLEQIVHRDGGFVSAIYRLAMQYQKARQPDKARPLFERFKELSAVEVSGGSFTVDKMYGAAGKYYQAVGADHLPLPKPVPQQAHRIVFSPEAVAIEPPARAWQWHSNSIRLPGIAVGDVDADGQLDLCLAGHGPDGATTILRNTGSGQFAPPERLADHGVVPCFGDIDNDGDLDLWLGRAGTDLLFINDGKGHFQKSVTNDATGPPLLTSTARLLDIDSDGDLDLLALRLAEGAVPASTGMQAAAGSLLRNNRDGSLTDVAQRLGLAAADIAMATVVYDDFDNDRDLDLILFPANQSPLVWVNERVWKYRLVSGDRKATAAISSASPGLEPDGREANETAVVRPTMDDVATGLDIGGSCGATTGDPNKDGLRDLLVFSGDRVRLLHNRGHFRFEADTSFADQHGTLGGTSGQFVDIDNDGDLDIVIADAHRRDGTRGPVLLLSDWPNHRFLDAAQLDPGLLLSALQTDGPAACVAADFTGNGLCDLLLVAAGSPPQLLKNVTQGGHWIALDLEGTRPRDRMARSNRSAIGARVEVKAGSVFQQHVVGTTAGPTAMAPLRVHAGLGPHPNVEWLRILWPDAVLQAELELAADQAVSVVELPRKTSSCPHLFAWDGSRYVFVSDFGGMGGLGYLIAPGRYAPPDPTEYVPLPQLGPRQDHYVLQVLEPLEETIYFDEAKLVAVDHREGTTVYPREMLACEGAPPPFELFCYADTIQPVRATDHRGHDVTDRLRKIDRQVAGATDLDDRYVGYAADHFVQLDFGDRLSRLPAGTRTILYLHGWVDYAYSTTNFAASQAGLELKAPTIQVWREGEWHDLFRQIGYPAGLRHMMTVDMTGKLKPTDRRLRITNNMELFWDRIFLATHRGDAVQRVQEVAAVAADLHFRGYPRDYSPDGRQPNLYDYANIDSSQPWKLMAGSYTRFGDVRQLLDQRDDCYVIMGRGEEVTLKFPTAALGPVPLGCVRSFLLKTDSYCKDMDLYTAFPDTVEPLPFHAMTSYPYGPDEHYPDNAMTRDYRRHYNTRRVQGKRY
jgi:tetratricopeptide (TPR) repeat protein